MIISGIVMASRPEHMAAVVDSVSLLSWAEVHQSDETGRMVVTIEAQDLDESMSRLRELQQLPRVSVAELSQYIIEDEGSAPGDH